MDGILSTDFAYQRRILSKFGLSKEELNQEISENMEESRLDLVEENEEEEIGLHIEEEEIELHIEKEEIALHHDQENDFPQLVKK